ncbi:cytosolic non-specific dipeptidase-like [Drosophila tropicalis]|uniref:cytosolic non-specific dipeptidase-like n=1 Tax=Drosophila tropicalis TaxID=46794 RepID=UPI0035ABFD69
MEDNSQLEPPTACHCENCQMHLRKPVERNSLQMQRQFWQVLTEIDHTTDKIVEELEDYVARKTISSDVQYMPECLDALDMVRERLEKMKFYVDDYTINLSRSVCSSDHLQKVLFADYFSSPTKNTLLIYTYLDVAKAKMYDGWLSNPFELKISDGLLYGRGVTTGKGMTVCWLNAIECWLKQHQDLPINVKIIVETMHEMGSAGLQQYMDIKKNFFLDVDVIVFGNNSWMNDEGPVISCSLAGWATFGMELRGADKHLEGGLAGGLVYEPMTDVCHLMDSLVDNRQELRITQVNEMVKPLLHHEWELLESAAFSDYDYKDKLDIRRLRYELGKAELLQHRWCHSNITMHGIENCFSRPGSSTMLPMTVLAKFSIKLVPNQEVQKVQGYVEDYLYGKHLEQKMNTILRTYVLDSCDPYSWPFDNRFTKATIRAIENVFYFKPELTSSIVTCLPIASLFCKHVKKPIILLPYTQRVDSSDIINESIPAECFINYVKTCASLMHELSMLSAKCKCDVIYEYCNRRGNAEILEAARTTMLPSGTRKAMKLQIPKLSQTSVKVKGPDETESPLKRFLCMPFRRKKKDQEPLAGSNERF